MQRSWGDPPWQRIDVPTRPLESSTPEVAIIGGGLTGLSAAYHLARRGVRTVLLEASSFGDGASGRTGGIVLEGTARGILEGTGACVPALERLVHEEGIECELELQGCWEIEHQPGGNALPWNDDGAPVRIVRTVAGGTIEPMTLLAGLANAAVRAGAILHEHASVKRLVPGAPPVLELEGATIRPNLAVVAANAWIGSLLPNLRPLRSALTFACATEPLDLSALREIGLGPGLPFYTVDLPYLWGRLLSGGRVIFGAGLVFDSPEQLERLDVQAGEPMAALSRLEARIRRLNPALKEVRFSARWGGPIAIPENFAPLIGRLPGRPTVLVAGGYSGHGVALSAWTGEVMARAIVDGERLPDWGALERSG